MTSPHGASLGTTRIGTTRLGIAGDWHGNTTWAKAAIEVLPDDIDLLIHLGDFGFMGSNFVASYLHKVNKWAQQRGLTIWVVPGNHENYDWLATQPVDAQGRTIAAPNVLALPRGHRFMVGDLSACAVGGAVSIDQGRRTIRKTWWPQEAITDEEAAATIEGGHADLLFTHDMPLDSGCPGLSQRDLIQWAGVIVANDAYVHHRRVRDIVEALTPSNLIHGHMHERYTNPVAWKSTDGEPCDCVIDGLGCDGMRGNLGILTVDGSAVTITDLLVRQG